MIRQVRDEDKEVLIRLLEKKNPFAALISTLYNAFYKIGLCEIFLCRDRYGRYCVAAKYFGELTIYAERFTSVHELAEFIDMSPDITMVFCENKVAKKLISYIKSDMAVSSSYIVRCRKMSEDFKVPDRAKDLKEVFSLLKAEFESYKGTVYEEFYCDVFHRQKIGADGFFIKIKDSELLSCASVLSKNGCVSVISNVATKKQHRNQGHARTLISGICNDIVKSGAMPYLFCATKGVYPFYKKLGFRRSGKFARLTKIST